MNNDRSLKKSFTGKSNGPGDENTDLFSVNRGTSLDVLLKPRRHSFEQAKVFKPEPDDDKKHVNDPLHTVPEVTLGTLSRLVLEARNVTSKLQSFSTTKAGSRRESDPSSKPTRSGSTTRPSNIPSLRSSSVPKKTTTVSAPAPKRTVSRSLTPSSRKTPSPSLIPSSRKTPSPSSTPSRIRTTTSATTPSFKKAGDVSQRSRSLTPRSKTQIAANSSPRTNVRSASVSSPGCVRRDSATPQTPPRLKEKVTLAFGRPLKTTGNVNSPKRNTSPDVTRTKPKVHSPSMIPTFSGVSHTTATPKSVKPSVATVADSSTRPGRRLSKASVQMAINHLDVARNGKVSTQPYSSTMVYPHSIRSSSTIRKRYGSSEGSSNSSNQEEEEEGRSLTKEEDTENKKNSARYDALLNVKDVKDTNWLLNVDGESSPPSLIFDNAFDSPPDLFPPL